MTHPPSAPVLTRALLMGAAGLVVVYLAVCAAFPWITPLGWFGRPGSVPTIAIVTALLTAVCVLHFRAHNAGKPSSVPVAIIVVLTCTSLILAISSYARCQDPNHPAFFTPLMWTAGTVKGGIDDHSLGGQMCPFPTPVALVVARIAGLSAIFVGVISLMIALLTTQLDRVRVRFAKSVTAVVDLNSEARSMVTALAGRLEKNSRLAVIVAESDIRDVEDLRSLGARIIGVELDNPDDLAALPLWDKLDKLYLLSPNPSANLQRLAVIGRRLSGGDRQRLPLIVRIDDPWQAESWRAQQLGGSDTRWAADAVGIYEVTAGRLLDRILGGAVRRIIVCGTSPLTLALAANLVRGRLERRFRNDPAADPLPTLVIVGDRAEEYRQDNEFHQRQLELPSTLEWIDAVNQAPSMSVLAPLITAADGADPASTAVIVVDHPAVDATLGTRLATRFPTLPIFTWDPQGVEIRDAPPVVGQLRTFRLAMDRPKGHAHDAWERAAMLIHERYAAQAAPGSAGAKPWAELDEFYRGSNRRLVVNALWMVERIAGHTWDSFGGFPEPPGPSAPGETGPLARLAAIGFDKDAALAMAGAEHEDWARYYRAAGWQYGPKRDNKNKVHNMLLPWDDVRKDAAAETAALTSLADTLYALRELGYRSHPLWQRFRPTGVATTDGVVRARLARDGEPIETSQGPVAAANTDWIVEDSDGAKSVEPASSFTAKYEPVSM